MSDVTNLSDRRKGAARTIPMPPTMPPRCPPDRVHPEVQFEIRDALKYERDTWARDDAYLRKIDREMRMVEHWICMICCIASVTIFAYALWRHLRGY